jgi:RNA polymerase sigma-70 factor, ECF subfamily
VQDEPSLIERAKQRDPVALTQIYEENFDRIYRYIALKIGDRTEAEDLTQQVFLNALQSISGYRSKGLPLTSWLYRIAHNQIVDHLRKVTRKPALPLDESLPIPDPVGDQSHEIEMKFEMEEVAVAAKQLTKAQQEVISLRFAAELSITEVSMAMGKSEGAIKALQHSAIAALRKILTPELNRHQGVTNE